MVTSFRGTARLETVSPLLPAPRPQTGNRLLVPVIRGQSAASLLSIGDAIAARLPSGGVVLSLVEIPPTWSGMVTSAVVRSRELLRWIAASDYEPDAGQSERLSIQSRFTTDPTASIREALLETQCDTVLIELPPSNARRRHRLEAILKRLSNDPQVSLVIARPDPAALGGAIAPRSVLVPLRGGPNAWLALGVGMAIASWARARLTLMHVFDPLCHHALLHHEAAIFHQLTAAAETARPEIVEVFSGHPADAMLEVAADHDVVVLGAYADASQAGLLLGQMLSTVVSNLTRTVILTRAATEDLYPAA